MFVIAIIAVAAFSLGSGGHAPINSVAVLPFSNASSDLNVEYLSDGITEGVIDLTEKINALLATDSHQ